MENSNQNNETLNPLRKIEALYSEMHLTAIIRFLCSAFLAYVLKDHANQLLLNIWLGITFVSCVIVAYCRYLFFKQKEYFQPYTWEKIYKINVFFAAFMWSISVFFTVGVTNTEISAIAITILVAVSFGGAMTHIISSFVGKSFVYGMIGAYIIKTIIEQGDHYITFALLQVVAIAYAIKLINKFNKLYESSESATLYYLKKLKLEKELKEERTRSMQSAKLASLGEVAAGIGHEINNPLSIMKGRLDILKDYCSKGDIEIEQAKNLLESMEKSMGRVSKIITSLKNISRIKEDSEFELVEVKVLVEEVLPLVERRIKEKGVELKIDLSSDIKILIDQGEITQVLINLIHNAADAISNLDERWVKVQCEESENAIKLLVIDSGAGIPTEFQEQVFEPFYTSKEKGSGTGLGLSLSKNLVARNKGELYYNNKYANTCFEIKFNKTK